MKNITNFNQVVPTQGTLTARTFENKRRMTKPMLFFDINISIQPFRFEDEDVSTEARLDSIEIPIQFDWREIEGKTFRFPENVDGYIDGSVYLGHTHNTARPTRLTFGQLESGKISCKLRTVFDFTLISEELDTADLEWDVQLVVDEQALDEVITEASRLITPREFDPTFRQVLLDCFAPLPVMVETEVEVSRLPRTMDALVLVESDAAHEQVRLHTPFQHFRTHNQIEFREGGYDSLTIWDYHQILGRTHLYMSENRVALDDMSVTVICGKPKTVLKASLMPHVFTSLGDGVYRRNGFPEVTLIVMKELPVMPTNYPFLLFSSTKRKFWEVMVRLLSEELFEYVVYAYQVRPNVTQEILDMAGVHQDGTERQPPSFIGELLPEQVVQPMSPEQIQRLKTLLEAHGLYKTIEKSNGNE